MAGQVLGAGPVLSSAPHLSWKGKRGRGQKQGALRMAAKERRHTAGRPCAACRYKAWPIQYAESTLCTEGWLKRHQRESGKLDLWGKCARRNLMLLVYSKLLDQTDLEYRNIYLIRLENSGDQEKNKTIEFAFMFPQV